MQPQESAGRHERQREEQDAGVPAAVGRLARRVAERERDRAHDPEHHEMERIVLHMRIELRPKEQRDEPDERERCGDHRHGDEGARARPLLQPGPRAGSPICDLDGRSRGAGYGGALCGYFATA